jgi:hypothetical protein
MFVGPCDYVHERLASVLVDLVYLHQGIFSSIRSLLAVNKVLSCSKIAGYDIEKSVFFSQYPLSAQGRFVAKDSQAHNACDCHDGGQRRKSEYFPTHRRMPTSRVISLRRPILHATSMAASVGANPSATHAIDSKISIAS